MLSMSQYTNCIMKGEITVIEFLFVIEVIISLSKIVKTLIFFCKPWGNHKENTQKRYTKEN